MVLCTKNGRHALKERVLLFLIQCLSLLLLCLKMDKNAFGMPVFVFYFIYSVCPSLFLVKLADIKICVHTHTLLL